MSLEAQSKGRGCRSAGDRKPDLALLVALDRGHRGDHRFQQERPVMREELAAA